MNWDDIDDIKRLIKELSPKDDECWTPLQEAIVLLLEDAKDRYYASLG